MVIDRVKTARMVSLAAALALPIAAASAPTVFPTGVTIQEQGVAEGHVLLGGQDGLVYLIDGEGNAVHSWTFWCGWKNAIEPLPDGHILTKSCLNIVEVNWDGTIVWEFAPPPGVVFHHDAQRLPNGNTLILGRRNILDPAISDQSIREDLLLEVSPAGEVVWEWYEADHFDEFSFSQERRDLIYEYGDDWSHCNTIAPIPDNTSHSDPRFIPGNIIISLRHQNTIAVIDRVTSEIVWVLTDATIGQHTTRMIPDDRPGGGHILAFDNGYAGDRSVIPNRFYSRIVEIDPFTGAFPYIYTADFSGLHIGSFASSAKSGVQRLANGNTLIAEAKSGRVFEVTAGGQIVWEYVSPYWNVDGNSNEVYRATKVPLDWAAPLFVPDLVVSGHDASEPARAGKVLEYTIQLENTGEEPAIHVELAAAVPQGTTFRSIRSPRSWSCSTPGVGQTGSVACTRSSLGAGASEVFGITLNVESCAGGDRTVANVVAASGAGADAFSGDNSTTIKVGARCP